MTRLPLSLGAFAAVAVAGSFTAATLAGCGHPTHGEMPPLAPRPERIDPAGSPAPAIVDPENLAIDAGSPALPKREPVAQITEIPTPAFRPDVGVPAPSGIPPDAGVEVEPPTNVSGTPADAGTPDSYAPPLPPVPDAHLPDSRLEPAAEQR